MLEKEPCKDPEMPLYEYLCRQCGRHTEKIQKFSDPELTVCPHCGGELARTLTAPAVQFKGSGWYKDLYSSAKPTSSNGSGSESSANASAPAASSGSEPAAPSASPASNTAPASSSTPTTAPAKS